MEIYYWVLGWLRGERCLYYQNTIPDFGDNFTTRRGGQ